MNAPMIEVENMDVVAQLHHSEIFPRKREKDGDSAHRPSASRTVYSEHGDTLNTPTSAELQNKLFCPLPGAILPSADMQHPEIPETFQALVFSKPRCTEVQEEKMPELSKNQLLIQSICSSISSGTELKV